MKQPEKQKTIARKVPTVTKPIARNDPTVATKPIVKLDPAATSQPEDLAVLPIEGVTMPTDDVSDLRDVVDAINRLCETMKTSEYDAGDDGNDTELCENVEIEVKVESDGDLVSPEQIVVSEVETYVAELWSDAASLHASVEAAADSQTREDTVSTLVLESYQNRNVNDVPVVSNRLTDVEHKDAILLNSSIGPEANMDKVALDSFATQSGNIVVANQSMSRVESSVFVASDPVVFDQELIPTSIEPVSEMYYTASSEVSLLSDVELADRIQEEVIEGKEAMPRDDRNGVMAGHVAAMRERFESMTRANTPCPDIIRSVSPSLDVYRNITPSPDHLG